VTSDDEVRDDIEDDLMLAGADDRLAGAGDPSEPDEPGAGGPAAGAGGGA
jgi:hypothetical protein